MDKQNISSQGQNITDPTKKISNQNLLSQQVSHTQQNQEGLLKILNELENFSMISGQTLKREIKSQIVRKYLRQNRIFKNGMCQVINQKESQHLIASYQDQQDKSFFFNLSTKNSNDQRLQSQHQIFIQQDKNCSPNDFSQNEDQLEQKQIIKQITSNNQINSQKLKPFKEKNQTNLQQDGQRQQHFLEQALKYEQTTNQANVYQQENTEKKQNISQQLDQQIYDEQKIIQQTQQLQENNILKQQNISEQTCQISHDIQPNLFEKICTNLKQNDEKNEIMKIQLKNNQNLQGVVEQLSKIQKNNKDYLISQAEQLELNNITIQQEIQSKTNQQHLEIIKSAKKQSNLFYCYVSQLKKIFGEIVAYKYTECEKKKKSEQSKKEWQEEIFEKNNCNQIQNEIFQSQKQKIFESLNQNEFYLCKVIHSNQIEDLIIGFFQCEHENFYDCIFKIIYNGNQSDIDSQTLIFYTLVFDVQLINLEQENISIIILSKDDFLSIGENLEQLVQFEQNIEKIENNYEINSQNCLECTICEDQNTCENQSCFKNIKSRILKFLQKKKYSYSQYENKLVKGIIFQLSQEKFIIEYLNYVLNTIFSFLENDQIDEQNISQQQLIQITESVSEKKQNSSLEEINKQINNVDLINEYSFLEYKVIKILYQNQQETDQSDSYQMQWDVNIFNNLNKMKVSDRFLKQQEDVIQILKTKNYFLCYCLITNQQEDIFIGYQEEIKEKYINYVFVIKYNLIDSEIQKYLQIKYFNQEINHFVINDFVHIFILAKDTFLQIYNKFEKINQIKIEWAKDQFEQINKDKDINLSNCKKCTNCKNKQGCSEYLNFKKFQEQKNKIFEILIQKNYYICEYLNKGGEGIIFKGYQQFNQEKQEYIFKILFDSNQELLEEEIKIMKMFDNHIYIIKFIEFTKITDNIHILILEKCQFSLKDELEQLKQKNYFPLDKLLQMIFSLLDGLIQFRIYNILHLDIKPQNILLNNSGLYVYTDFGISSLKKNNSKVQVKGFSENYASPEQKDFDRNTDYQSDIYSLGKTFQVILRTFQDIQQQNFQEIIKEFMKKIKENMLQNQPKNRLDCLNLRNEFFQYIIKQKECIQFLQSYVTQIQQILDSYPYDQNKEISYFLQISLFYEQDILDFWKEFIKQNLSNNNQQSQLNIANSLNNVSSCYENLGDNKKALAYQLESLQMRKQIFKENHPDIAESMNNVGSCYHILGDYKKALEYYLESLQIYKQIFKENHPYIARPLGNAGICYENLGDKKKGLEYQLETLQIYKQIFKKNHPSIAGSLNNVGLCYRNLGDNKKGLEYILESLQIYKQIFKENHPLIATSLSNAGICYQDLGDNKKGLEYQLESLQMRKQIFKENHPDIAQSLNNVGSCYQDLGDNKKGLEYYLESLQIFKQIFKENHPLIAFSLANVGCCYQDLGDNKKGLEYQLESLQMRKQIFKENHPDIAASLNNAGVCYENLGDNKKGLEYQLESLQMRKQIFKENHPDIAASLNNVGLCYINLGDNKKALTYQLESLQMRKQIFKENHPNIAASLANVGRCYHNLDDNIMALQYQLESLQMRKQIFKENHPNIAASLANVGRCYHNLDDNIMALQYQLESLQMRKQIFKENHPNIAASLANVGRCYHNLDDNIMALQYELESLQIFKQIFKENHPYIAASMSNVGVCYQNLGDNKKGLEYQLESLQMSKQIFKENHPDIVSSLNNVALFYKNIGDSKIALEYEFESFQMKIQINKEIDSPLIKIYDKIMNAYGFSEETLESQFELIKQLLQF